MSPKIAFLTASLVAVVAAVPVDTARAATDFKFIHANDCVPYGPGTLVGELTVYPSGLYNPGTTQEKVLCPLPRDQDDAYINGDIDITVYYRGLGTPGRVTCSLFVGSSNMQVGAVYTNTVVGDLAGSGGREYLVILGANQSTEFLTTPATVLCTLDPKMALAGLFFNESGPTNTP